MLLANFSVSNKTHLKNKQQGRDVIQNSKYFFLRNTVAFFGITCIDLGPLFIIFASSLTGAKLYNVINKTQHTALWDSIVP